MTFRVRAMQYADVPFLSSIEQSAGEIFRTIPDLAWIADADNLPQERHNELLASGSCWVAESEKAEVVAFLSAEMAIDSLHLWEFSVRGDCQRKGIGRVLLSRAIGRACENGLRSITLTTFRDVPWNEPMYQRLGFATLRTEECGRRLADILEQEVNVGLPRERRCAMAMPLPQAKAR